MRDFTAAQRWLLSESDELERVRQRSAGQDLDADLSYLVNRYRRGDLDSESIRWAAYLGYEPAEDLEEELGLEALRQPTRHQDKLWRRVQHAASRLEGSDHPVTDEIFWDWIWESVGLACKYQGFARAAQFIPKIVSGENVMDQVKLAYSASLKLDDKSPDLNFHDQAGTFYYNLLTIYNDYQRFQRGGDAVRSFTVENLMSMFRWDSAGVEMARDALVRRLLG